MIFIFSLNDSFARVKSELLTAHYQNEMMVFMWSKFRKITGMNKRKASTSEDANMKNNYMTGDNEAPLAAINTDDL